MINLNVCIGSACHIKGAYNVINAFQQIVEEYNISDQVGVKGVFCLGHCVQGVSVQIDDSKVYSVSGANAKEFFKAEVLPKLNL